MSTCEGPLEKFAYEFICNAQYVLLGWLVRWEASDHTAAVLRDAAFKISSKQHAASLYSFHQAFSLFFKVLGVLLCNSTLTATG